MTFDLHEAYAVMQSLCFDNGRDCTPLGSFKYIEAKNAWQARMASEGKSASNKSTLLKIKAGNRVPFVCEIQDFANDFSDYRTPNRKGCPDVDPAKIAARKREAERLAVAQQASLLQARRKAQARFSRAACGDNTRHPYTDRKGVGLHGVRIEQTGDGPLLLIPGRNSFGDILILSRIWPNGHKRFTQGSREGAFHTIGEATSTVLFAEGYATGASLYEATRLRTIVCFDTYGMKTIPSLIRAQTSARFVYCGDNDATKGNPGAKAAQEAAERVPAEILLPPTRGRDWNDEVQERPIRPFFEHLL